MLHWLISSSSQPITETVKHTIAFTQGYDLAGEAIATGLSSHWPLEFARATNGYVYMVDGLHAPIKWNGVALDVNTVGVAAPTVAPTLAFSGVGEITGDYRAYYRFVDADGNVSNLSPVSSVVTATDNQTAHYDLTGLAPPTNATRLEILRNTAGQFLVYYVDIDEALSGETAFTSTRTDTELRTRTAVPLFDAEFTRSLANRHGLPPSDKPIIAFHQNRLWLYGEVVYQEGSATVTNGSTTVTGIGTTWTTEMDGRFFYVRGAGDSYEIDSVDELAQTLTLASPYKGASDTFADYKIRPATGRRHLLIYSEAGQFDSWPAANAIEVASSDDIDDDPTGLASTHSFLYILQRRHIYRLTFLENPATDGGIFLAARRGVVNNRSWVSVDGFLYALDDRGIYRFDGSDSTEDLSQNIQDLFYLDSDVGDLRVNWSASQWFHASHERHDATIRWFVSLSGDRFPRHAICFNYSVPQWWIEEYPFGLGDSSVLKGVSSSSIVCGKNKTVWALQVGTLDVVDPSEGDTRGQIEAWTRRSVTLLAGTTLPSTGLVGAPLAIVEGAGKGQVRRIASVSGRTITVTQPWTTALDADRTDKLDTVSVVQIGAMPWRWKSGWMEWPILEKQQPRKISVGFKRTANANKVALRVFKEYAETPETWGLDWPRVDADSSGIETTKDSADAVFDTTVTHGYTYLTIDSFDFYDEYREGIVAVELAGFTAASSFSVFEIDVMGARG